MFNYRQRSLKKLFSRGVPLHAVDFPCDPFDVVGIGSQFGKSADRENVIERVIQAKHNFFASVSASVVLLFQFLSNQLSMFRGFKAVNGSLFEVAAFTERPVLSFHGRENRILAAVRTNTVSDTLCSPCFSGSSNHLGAVFTGTVLWPRWNLSAISTQVGGNQAIAAIQIIFTVAFFVLSTILAPLSRFSVSSLGFACSLLLFVYNGISHAVQAPILKVLVRPVGSHYLSAGRLHYTTQFVSPVSIGK
jgi:hypothetical protein